MIFAEVIGKKGAGGIGTKSYEAGRGGKHGERKGNSVIAEGI